MIENDKKNLQPCALIFKPATLPFTLTHGRYDRFTFSAFFPPACRAEPGRIQKFWLTLTSLNTDTVVVLSGLCSRSFRVIVPWAVNLRMAWPGYRWAPEFAAATN